MRVAGHEVLGGESRTVGDGHVGDVDPRVGQDGGERGLTGGERALAHPPQAELLDEELCGVVVRLTQHLRHDVGDRRRLVGGDHGHVPPA